MNISQGRCRTVGLQTNRTPNQEKLNETFHLYQSGWLEKPEALTVLRRNDEIFTLNLIQVCSIESQAIQHISFSYPRKES